MHLRRRHVGAGVRLLALLLLISCGSEPPSDEALVRAFDSHAEHYNQVIAMLSQDRGVGTIGRDFLFAADKPFVNVDVAQLGITEERLAEYKRLLALSGTIRLDRYREDVSFMTWASGVAGNTHHKGIAWHTYVPERSADRRHSHIRGNWYLYED